MFLKTIMRSAMRQARSFLKRLNFLRARGPQSRSYKHKRIAMLARMTGSGAGPGLGLDGSPYFHDTGNMEMTAAVDALAALAQETRLQVYRLLVEAGPKGLPAGRIGEALGLPPATLSFHLAHLARAGLARSRQEGRFVIYSADFDNMTALVGYLSENCCGGRSCAPITRKGNTNEALPRARRRA